MPVSYARWVAPTPQNERSIYLSYIHNASSARVIRKRALFTTIA